MLISKAFQSNQELTKMYSHLWSGRPKVFKDKPTPKFCCTPYNIYTLLSLTVNIKIWIIRRIELQANSLRLHESKPWLIFGKPGVQFNHNISKKDHFGGNLYNLFQTIKYDFVWFYPCQTCRLQSFRLKMTKNFPSIISKSGKECTGRDEFVKCVFGSTYCQKTKIHL